MNRTRKERRKMNHTDEPQSAVALRTNDARIDIPTAPTSGVFGEFMDRTADMFKARAMRCGGLLRRLDESGQRFEGLLKKAALKSEAMEADAIVSLTAQGLYDSEREKAEIYERAERNGGSLHWEAVALHQMSEALARVFVDVGSIIESMDSGHTIETPWALYRRKSA
jgi:hypothetical protein